MNERIAMSSAKLMTTELEAEFAKVGDQSSSLDPIIVAKFFNPTGAQTWLATEYDPEEKVFFGYASLFQDHCDEWGYFSLAEMAEFETEVCMEIDGQNVLLGTTGIERDLYFEPRPFSRVWDTEKHCERR